MQDREPGPGRVRVLEGGPQSHKMCEERVCVLDLLFYTYGLEPHDPGGLRVSRITSTYDSEGVRKLTGWNV